MFREDPSNNKSGPGLSHLLVLVGMICIDDDDVLVIICSWICRKKPM